MEKAKQNKFIAFLLIFLIVIALVLTGVLYMIFSSEGGTCLADPMGYYAEKLKKVNNNETIFCECKRESEFFKEVNFSEIEIGK